jgi:hypothetical protein
MESQVAKKGMLAQETLKGDRVLAGAQLTSFVYGALVKLLGLTNAQAIEFYVDTRLAVDNPDGYEQSMRRLLGEHGGSLVINGLKTELARGSGTERSSESFRSQVSTAEHVLSRSR